MNKLSVWWWALIVYSVAHFIYSAVYSAWTTLGGDVLSAFPGPLTVRVGHAWPALARDWTTEALGMGPVKWNYGPALHIMLLPFSFASTQFQATRLILLFDYALVAVTFVLWIRLLFPDSRPIPAHDRFHEGPPEGGRHVLAWIAILCLWLNYFPLLEAVVGREIELVELFLLTLAIYALRQQRETLAGASVGVAAMLKFLPAVFIPYLFVKGYRRAGWVAAATAVSIAILAQPLLGWQRAVTISIANKEIAGSDLRTSYANQALTNVLYKTFTAFNIKDPHPPTLYPQTLRPLAFSLSFVVVLATGWFIVRWRRYRFLEVEFALLAIVMCLVVSHANTYYFVFALPALSVALAAIAQRPEALGTLPKAALAAAIVLSGFLVPMKVFEVLTHVQGLFVARVLQGWSLPAYGAILAAGLMVELHRISRARVDAVR